jgi:hypothetical protein
MIGHDDGSGPNIGGPDNLNLDMGSDFFATFLIGSLSLRYAHRKGSKPSLHPEDVEGAFRIVGQGPGLMLKAAPRGESVQLLVEPLTI